MRASIRLRALAPALSLALLVPSMAGAQNSSESDSAAPQRCAQARRVIERGFPPVREAWAWNALAGCPADEQRETLARAIRAAGRLTDTLDAERLFYTASNWRDAGVLRAAMALAEDPAAGVVPRTLAFAVMNRMQFPQEWVGFGDLTIPASAPRAEEIHCHGAQSADATMQEGSPLPADWLHQVQALAERLVDDPATPAPLKRAASCML